MLRVIERILSTKGKEWMYTTYISIFWQSSRKTGATFDTFNEKWCVSEDEDFSHNHSLLCSYYETLIVCLFLDRNTKT